MVLPGLRVYEMQYSFASLHLGLRTIAVSGSLLISVHLKMSPSDSLHMSVCVMFRLQTHVLCVIKPSTSSRFVPLVLVKLQHNMSLQNDTNFVGASHPAGEFFCDKAWNRKRNFKTPTRAVGMLYGDKLSLLLCGFINWHRKYGAIFRFPYFSLMFVWYSTKLTAIIMKKTNMHLGEPFVFTDNVISLQSHAWKSKSFQFSVMQNLFILLG